MSIPSNISGSYDLNDFSLLFNIGPLYGFNPCTSVNELFPSLLYSSRLPLRSNKKFWEAVKCFEKWLRWLILFLGFNWGGGGSDRVGGETERVGGGSNRVAGVGWGSDWVAGVGGETEKITLEILCRKAMLRRTKSSAIFYTETPHY